MLTNTCISLKGYDSRTLEKKYKKAITYYF